MEYIELNYRKPESKQRVFKVGDKVFDKMCNKTAKISSVFDNEWYIVCYDNGALGVRDGRYELLAVE